MKYKNSIKFSLLLVLMGMCISLIINYHINMLEIENMITSSQETSSLTKSKYETSILNPQYFFYDNENGISTEVGPCLFESLDHR